MINLSGQILRLSQTAKTEIGWFVRQIRPRRLRSMREFAEQEVIIPDGPHQGRRYRCSRQPFHATPHEHLSLAKHLTAEVKTEEFVKDKGVVVKWEKRNKHNHWFDALYNACAAAHYCGVRLVAEPPKPRQRQSLQWYHERANPSARPSARQLADMAKRRGG